jgi:hypothetical protein
MFFWTDLFGLMEVQMRQPEEWRVCACAPSYSISSLGRVMRTTDGAQPWSKAGKVLRPDINKDGHHRVTLFVSGKRHRAFVHRLVCEAWHGPAPTAEHCALHDDDVKSNNTPSNLSWGTNKKNGEDRVRNGISVRGTRVNTARLTEDQVLEIRVLASEGATNLSLARRFGVPDGQISKIVRGIDWKHIGGPIRGILTRGVHKNRAYCLGLNGGQS